MSFRAAVAVLLMCAAAVRAGELQKFEGCAYVPAEWADGDSFRVSFPDGKEHTVRLYGADCLESRAGDATDSRRLRGQRRYFGITGIEKSTEVALGYGKQGAEETRRRLEKPFTVYTAFADARGSPKYSRIYGFVVTSEGKDLAAHLVSVGLARAFGVCRKNRGLSAGDYEEQLRDLEMRAAKRGLGIWSRTDWDSLPEERKLERREEAEDALAIHGPPLEEGSLDPNTAARDDLMRLPGVGEVLATRIVEARPYAKPEDLLKVRGIGDGKLERIRPFLKFGK